MFHLPHVFLCVLGCTRATLMLDVGMVMVFTVVGVETVSTNAEYNMILITSNTVKMVAEHFYGTALYSAVDNCCKVVAADSLSLIALSP